MSSDKWRTAVPVLVAVLLFSTPPGCSVKEDRNFCPCALRLYFRDPPRAAVLVASDTGSDVIRRDTVFLEGRDTAVWLRLEGNHADLAVYQPIDCGFSVREGLRIPSGEAAPPLWLDAFSVPLTEEEVADTVCLHKEYCFLEIRIKESGGVPAYPFRLCFRGNVGGVSRTGDPVEGAFEVVREPDADGTVRICLPRQRDASLLLDITDGENRVRTFALGEYLEQSGYDWAALDLADQSMTLDFSRTAIRLEIGSWKRTYACEVVI